VSITQVRLLQFWQKHSTSTAAVTVQQLSAFWMFLSDKQQTTIYDGKPETSQPNVNPHVYLFTFMARVAKSSTNFNWLG